MKKHLVKLTLLCLTLVLGMYTTTFAQQRVPAQKTVVQPSGKTNTTSGSPMLSAFKVAPLGPMVGNWGITYERGAVFNNDISLEINAGYRTSPLLFRGLLRDVDANTNGFYLSAGPKIYFGKQEFTIDGMRRTHPIFGWYFKPELGYRYTVFKGSDNSEVKSNVARLMLNVGKQWVSNRFVFELYTGIGYAYRNYTGKNNDIWDEVSESIRENFPIAAQSGIRMGLLTR